MALESVSIYLEDIDTSSPISGVVVRVFNQAGTTLITTATSDLMGYADLTLDGGSSSITYQLRFYKAGVSFTSPQAIEVFSPPAGSPTGTNTFEVPARVHVLPEAVDPLLCRASGYIVWPDGRPYKGARIDFIYLGKPQMLNDRGVLGERINLITDATGYVQVDLIRGACYRAVPVSDHATQRMVVVPDRPSCNISKLLYPIITSIVWGGPPTMTIGQIVTFTPAVMASFGAALVGTADGDIEYTMVDPSIISMMVDSEKVTLTALAAGTTTLRAKRKDCSIAYAPDVELIDAEFSITVS
jgi:hypothetical protein